MDGLHRLLRKREFRREVLGVGGQKEGPLGGLVTGPLFSTLNLDALIHLDLTI